MLQTLIYISLPAYSCRLRCCIYLDIAFQKIQFIIIILLKCLEENVPKNSHSNSKKNKWIKSLTKLIGFTAEFSKKETRKKNQTMHQIHAEICESSKSKECHKKPKKSGFELNKNVSMHWHRSSSIILYFKALCL